jgi:hypothetical protein
MNIDDDMRFAKRIDAALELADHRSLCFPKPTALVASHACGGS